MSIIYALRDNNRYVYHYTDADKALNYILKNKTLLLNNFAATNDPKESKEWKMIPFTMEQHSTDDFVNSKLHMHVATKLKSSAYLSCFCSDTLNLTGDHTVDILKRGLARPRMWAQYADRHRGFCLVFDREILLKKIKEQFPARTVLHGHVNYIDRSWANRLDPHAFRVEYDLLLKVGLDEYCRLHINHYSKELYFDKLRDWRDEHEWRIVLLEPNGPPSLLNFEDALVGVVHGDCTPTADSERAISLVPESCVEHTGLKWQNHCPWYDLGNRMWFAR
jgi:Protein of unknown function (DUF2971)